MRLTWLLSLGKQLRYRTDKAPPLPSSRPTPCCGNAVALQRLFWFEEREFHCHQAPSAVRQPSPASRIILTVVLVATILNTKSVVFYNTDETHTMKRLPWWIVSLIAGTAAVLFAVAVCRIQSPGRWFLIIAAAVFLVVLNRNPLYFYRRLAATVTTAWVAVVILPSLAAYLKLPDGSLGFLHIDGVGPALHYSFGASLIVLIGADFYRNWSATSEAKHFTTVLRDRELAPSDRAKLLLQELQGTSRFFSVDTSTLPESGKQQIAFQQISSNLQHRLLRTAVMAAVLCVLCVCVTVIAIAYAPPSSDAAPPNTDESATIAEKLRDLDERLNEVVTELIAIRTQQTPSLPASLKDSRDLLKAAVIETREEIRHFEQRKGPLPQSIQTQTVVLERAESVLANPLDFIWEEAAHQRARDTTELSPAQIASLSSHTGTVLCMSFSADGKLLATGSEDKTMRIWNTGDWTLRSILRGYDSAIQCVAFSPDGRLLAWGGDGSRFSKVKIWNFQKACEHATLRLEFNSWPSRAYSVAFSPNSQALAVGSSGPLRVFDLLSGETFTRQWQRSVPSYTYSVTFSPDGNTVAAGCHGGDIGDTVETVRQWKWRDNREGDTLVGGNDKFMSLSHSEVRGVVAFSDDGKSLMRITSGASESTPRSGFGGFGPQVGSLKEWSLEDGSLVNLFEVPHGNAYALTISESRLLIASANGPKGRFANRMRRTGEQQSILKLWDSHFQTTSNVTTGHVGGVGVVTFSPDGSLVATAGKSRNIVKVWDVAEVTDIGRRKTGNAVRADSD